MELLLTEASGETGELDVDNLADFLVGESVEDDDLVDAVQKLRAEVATKRLHDALVPFLHSQILHDVLAADITRHDDNGVLEVHSATLTIGDPSVVKDLEEDIEDIAVGLLHLVEEDHGVGLPADGLAELTPLLITHVSGRSSDETSHGVLLHVLGHVEPDDGVLVVKKELGQGLGKLGLTDTRGAKEHEGTDGAVLFLKAGAGSADGVGNGLDGLSLSHHTLDEALLHLDKFLPLSLLEVGDGDTSPDRDHFGDIFFGNLFLEQRGLAALGELGIVLLELGLQFRNAPVLDLARFGEISLTLGDHKLVLHRFNLLVDLLGLADLFLLLLPAGLQSRPGFLGLGEFLLKFL